MPQHPRVREVLDAAKTSAEAAREQHKAGATGMPIKDTPRRVTAERNQQSITLEELDRSSYTLADSRPVVVLRAPDGSERYFQWDEADSAWREISDNDIRRADSDPHVKAQAEQEDRPFADYEDPVVAWQKALNDLLADLRP